MYTSQAAQQQVVLSADINCFNPREIKGTFNVCSVGPLRGTYWSLCIWNWPSTGPSCLHNILKICTYLTENTLSLHQSEQSVNEIRETIYICFDSETVKSSLKLYLCLIKHNAMHPYVGVFLALSLQKGEQWPWSPNCFAPGEHQNRSGHCGGKKTSTTAGNRSSVPHSSRS
jgi:hypothetical protein